MTLSDDANREIGLAEDQLRKLGQSLKKILSLLTTAKAKTSKVAWPLHDVRKLLADLAPLVSPASESTLRPLLEHLKQAIEAAEPEFERELLSNLSREAQNAPLPFGSTTGIHFLGPFELRIDRVKEVAELLYARHSAISPLALNPKLIVETAAAAAKRLLEPPTDFSKLSAEFEQAHQVALVRDRKPIEGRETRTSLPELFREVQFIRQQQGRRVSNDAHLDYSIPRFIVELKSLVQSEANLESPKRFRLETAVIENTKNAKKSVFVPADLKAGYGEGTYFQALILVNENR